MKEILRFIAIMTFTILVLLAAAGAYGDVNPDDAYTDPKECGFVPRNADGTIKRSSAEVAHFQLVNPCPSTGLTTGSCPGWSVDHIKPLACGGCDKIVNMAWMPNPIKSCSGTYCKDRLERKIQYYKGPIPGMNESSCKTTIIPYESSVTTVFITE